MYRARFYVPDDDYRPISWPVKHPYWCSGFSDEYSVLIAYVDDERQLLEYWPDAMEVDLGAPVEEYVFTSRFQKPEWFKEQSNE